MGLYQNGRRVTLGFPAEVQQFKSRYDLVQKQLVPGAGGCLSCQLDDFAVNDVEISSNSSEVRLYLPPQDEVGKVRDFVVRLDVTALSSPTIGFYPSGSESVDFESEDAQWYDIEPGVNIISMTETK